MIQIKEIPLLKKRQADSNKGTYGKVLVVAGSQAMSGAAILCGTAALRSGAGLVEVATSSSAWPIVAAGNPCYMSFPFNNLEELIFHSESSSVVAIGPGLGKNVEKIVKGLLSAVTNKPLVIDADGLNALGIEPAEISNHLNPIVLTPHPGEFARLLGKSTKDVQSDRINLAIQFANKHRLILVLKGHKTIVTDGERIYFNTTGNPGMATGGTGDILTGIIAGLIAQGLNAFESTILAVWVHGRAGDLAANILGEVSLIASDLLDYLPNAFCEQVAV